MNIIGILTKPQFPELEAVIKDLVAWLHVRKKTVALGTSAATFAEPLTFSLRAHRELIGRLKEFDLVHDNQCLGTGILKIHEAGLPVLETIHHPITVDRRLETKHATTPWKRFTKNRF